MGATRRRRIMAFGLCALPAAMVACGTDGDSARPGPSAEAGVVEIEVSMQEFSFSPPELEVPPGTVVRFTVTNRGVMAHELVIGDTDFQEMAESMRWDDDLVVPEHLDGVPTIMFLDPGDVGTIEHTFDEPTELLIGCHLPGHWASGMRGTLRVT